MQLQVTSLKALDIGLTTEIFHDRCQWQRLNFTEQQFNINNYSNKIPHLFT